MNIGNNASALDVAIKISGMDCIVPVADRVRKVIDFGMSQTRESLIRDLVKIRRELIDPYGREIFGESYPVGQCLFIRDQIFQILQGFSRPIHPDYSDFSPSRIPLRKIWCIKNNICMNNGIQYGNWIIDAANDTTDREKYPVTVLKVEDSGMRNPHDHEDLCHVFEKYWPVQCYPNVYYPELAPFFPVIFVFKGKVGFAELSLIRLDMSGVSDGFTSAYNFLFQSSFSKRRLSDEHVKILRSKKCTSPSLETQGAVNIHQIQTHFSRLRKLGPSKLAEGMLSYYKLLEKNQQMVISDGL